MSWRDGKMTSASIKATADCTFSIKGISGKIKMKKGEEKRINF